MTQDFEFAPLTGEVCPEGVGLAGDQGIFKERTEPLTRSRVQRRQAAGTTPGYVTTGAFLSQHPQSSTFVATYSRAQEILI